MPGRWVGLAGPVLIALLLAPALAVAPPFAGPAAGAPDTLRETASATYVADPANAVVHVTVSESAQNLKPDVVSGGVIRQFYYDELVLPIHTEASNVSAADKRGALRVTRETEDGYDIVRIRLRSAIYFHQTASITLRYDLTGGAPRSTSQIRVGRAFVGLYLYAWGDAGLGSVRLELPTGFDPEVNGDTLDESTLGGAVVLSATEISEPFTWFSIVSANRDASLAISRLALGNGNTIVVRAWPEDAEWQTRVEDTLRLGTPLLRTLVGLDWPVDGELVVTEVQSAALEGFAGIYDPSNDTILITEELDELTIVHEASHAWFNDALFDARWIDEGLADAYASTVLDQLQIGEYEPPERPRLGSPGAGPLDDWVFPGRIADDATADREDYGYNASWYIVRSLLDEVGEAGMRGVLRAAANDEIAYLGDGPPEKVPANDDWRRFLDLLEERAGSTEAEDLFSTFILTSGQVADLAARAAARQAYARLAVAGDGLAPPFVVRQAMSTWSFENADRWIAEATDLLGDRAALEGRAEALDVALPADVDEAWRDAECDLDGVHDAVTALDDALADLISARAELDAERDFVVSVGLLGTAPESGWDIAVEAFEADDLPAADRATDDVVALLAGAPDAGRARLAGGGAVLGAVVLGGILVVRRRRSTVPVAVAAVTTSPGEPAAAAEASATLPPEPDAPKPQRPPDASVDPPSVDPDPEA
jgi:hypothetical protein